VRLIVTEKNIAADKIAAILARGKPQEEAFYKVPYYRFTDAEGRENVAVGLKGHVLQVEFPPEYSDWRKVDPSALIDAPLIKGETAKSVIRAIRKLATQADSLVIATDYDREGELIGLEALEIAGDENESLIRTARRARFSALTKGEVEHAFGELEYLSEPLARAGEARQDIDLIWGATLTRFVSLATSRLGNQFLSVGRVQSPTLGLIVQREKERRAFVPEAYWVVTADLKAKGLEFGAVHKQERFSSEEQAKAAYERAAGPGIVTSVKRTEKKVTRPAPFNTTSFMTAATSLGFSAAAVMNVAETLYMNGYISYPRTDNTVYPASLDLREVLEAVRQGEFRREAEKLLDRAALTPSRGNKRTTDHPPIYPTGPARKGELDDRAWKIYELVARRFFATLADDAVSESNRIDLDLGGEPFFVRGSRVLSPGWLAYYPYSRQKDSELPALSEGEQADLLEKHLEGKETQPPGRYSQGSLMELMEKHNLGTKATRHNIIQNLYDRGYIHGNPVEPTETGVKMAEALEEYAPRIASPEMTAHLEADMDLIAEREQTKDAVVAISRDLLREAYRSLEGNKEQVAARIFEGITDDRILGDCPKCQKNRLRVLRSKTSRKRFVGCEGYPDCDQTYPLPQRGDIVGLNETCPECGSPRIKVLGGRRPWILCLDPECPTKDEYKARRAAKASANGDGDEQAKPAGGRGKASGGNGGKAKAPAKKTAAKKTAAKKTATKKTAAKKTSTRKAAESKGTTAEQTSSKKAASADGGAPRTAGAEN
jgi:DNA topoisomerase I